MQKTVTRTDGLIPAGIKPNEQKPNEQKPDRRKPGECVFLVKLGELTLKGGNREGFEKILRRNLTTMLKARAPGAAVLSRPGRLYVVCSGEQTERVEAVLGKLAGITGWAETRVTGKTTEQPMAACVE